MSLSVFVCVYLWLILLRLEDARAEVLAALGRRGLAGHVGAPRGVRAVAAHRGCPGRGEVEVVAVVLVVGADVARLARPLALVLECLDDGRLDDLAAAGVDRVGDV